ncbi:MAG: glycine--tRNA ligase subunit beta, partial [Novosphingobium sp.]
KPGRATAEVLAETIPAIVRAFPWPKSQRWGAASISTESLRWVRPLSTIVALFDGQVVECEVGGIKAGRLTKGHRFHSSGEISVDGVDDYAAKLRAAHVIVDHVERQDLIRSKASEAAAAVGLKLVEDEGLVIENAGLTEWPVPLLGRFDEQFLEVPPEVIQLTARTNQKYFVCEDAAGKLANAFVCTANIAAADGGAAIVAGNRKVLAARLSDARFFWEQDRKTALSDHAKKLERITFHEKLGTVADKVERVAKLARWLEENRSLPGCEEAELAEQAARLCKADLVTEMVGEFPELQGLMGGYYARAEGLPDAVADAIRDHYKPVGQGDEVPTDPVTVAVALADKLDSLFSFFAYQLVPTGSKDPFALRRAAIGALSIIQSNQIRLKYFEAFEVISPLLPVPTGSARGLALIEYPPFGKVDVQAVALLNFIIDRLKVQQREAGVRHDLIDAVFALGGEDDLVRLLARVHALQAFVGTEDGANLLAGYKRAANILKKEDFTGGEEIALSYTPEPAERALVDALAEAGPRAAAAVAGEDFARAMAALASLRAPIDAFFEQVTVNDADPAKRTFRLNLLARLRDAVHGVADFSKIEG